MMSWLSLLPPLLAIVIAIWKREVILALLVAIYTAELIQFDFNLLTAFVQSIDRISNVLSDSANSQILLFSLLIGALLSLFKHSGGVSSFVQYLLDKKLASSPRSVSFLTALLGVLIFIESNLSILTAGIFAQKLFDKYNMSRARLALIIDSTCSPVSVLILLNAWGAYILGLLEGYQLDNPVQVMLLSIPFNFYALMALVLVFYTCWSSRVHFSLAQLETQEQSIEQQQTSIIQSKKRYFLLPLITLITAIIGFMLYTGNGQLIKGSGSSSVLYATVLAIIVAYALLRIDKRYQHTQLISLSFQGMGELLPLVCIVLLAFALGDSMQTLGTGQFIAEIISANLPSWSIAAVIFLAAGLISFTTGTSWGTFGILIPVAIPLAISSELSPSLLLAAVLSGGVFGDHCSPISDSTVLSSLASGCEHLEHVRTQLPYALLSAGIALPLFILASLTF